jgi:hypothetical protein
MLFKALEFTVIARYGANKTWCRRIFASSLGRMCIENCYVAGGEAQEITTEPMRPKFNLMVEAYGGPESSLFQKALSLVSF